MLLFSKEHPQPQSLCKSSISHILSSCIRKQFRIRVLQKLSYFERETRPIIFPTLAALLVGPKPAEYQVSF